MPGKTLPLLASSPLLFLLGACAPLADADDVSPGVPGDKADDLGEGWTRVHPLVVGDALTQPFSLNGELWMVRGQTLTRFIDGQYRSIDIPGVESVVRVKKVGEDAVIVLGADKQVRWFDAANGWTNLPDTPGEARDIAALDRDRVWIATKWNLLALAVDSWESVDDFPKWGTINNTGWRNLIEVAPDGQLWATSAYHSERPKFSHFDGTEWQTFPFLARRIHPLPNGEAIVSKGVRLARFPENIELINSRDFVDRVDGLPDWYVPSLNAIHSDGNRIWAVAREFMLEFDGETWKRVALPLRGTVRASGVTIYDGLPTLTSAEGLFQFDGETVRWLSQEPGLAFDRLPSLAQSRDSETLVAANTSGILRISSDGDVTRDDLPELGFVKRVVFADDGAAWAQAEHEVTEEETGLIHQSQTVWRRQDSTWTLIKQFGFPDHRSYALATAEGGAIYLSLADRVERIDGLGNATVVLEEPRAVLSSLDDELWAAPRYGLPFFGKGDQLSQVDVPVPNPSTPEFRLVAGLEPGKALASSVRGNAWILTPDGGELIGEMPGVNLLVQGRPGRALNITREAIFEFDGIEFKQIASLKREWGIRSCSETERQLVCSGSRGLIITRDRD